jgi:hypothetical protein
MELMKLVENVMRKRVSFTVDDVWREVIAYVAVAGKKVNITKDEIMRYLDSRKDLIESEGVYYYGADIQEG